jgi:hypothetical protein
MKKTQNFRLIIRGNKGKTSSSFSELRGELLSYLKEYVVDSAKAVSSLVGETGSEPFVMIVDGYTYGVVLSKPS